jgi:hypothetical protein
MNGAWVMNWSILDDVVRSAEQFGPFLFAILFILVVTRTAHGYYRECNMRKDPPASEQERRTYRLYFICSVWCGIVAMALSIVWWGYAQLKGTYVYQIAIVGLREDESVLANYFQKRVPRPSVAGGIAVHDLYFLIVQEEPFRVGDNFSFDYYKIPQDAATAGSGAAGIVPAPIEIKYGGNKSDIYRLTPDADSPRLTIVASNQKAVDDFFTADEIKVLDPHIASASVATRAAGGR